MCGIFDQNTRKSFDLNSDTDMQLSDFSTAVINSPMFFTAVSPWEEKALCEGAARAPAARLAARSPNREGHPHLRIEGHFTSWTIYFLCVVLVCCANRHDPTSTRSTCLCNIWVCISSSSSSSSSRNSQPPLIRIGLTFGNNRNPKTSWNVFIASQRGIFYAAIQNIPRRGQINTLLQTHLGIYLVSKGYILRLSALLRFKNSDKVLNKTKIPERMLSFLRLAPAGVAAPQCPERTEKSAVGLLWH